MAAIIGVSMFLSSGAANAERREYMLAYDN